MKIVNYTAIVNDKAELSLTREQAQGLDAVETLHNAFHVIHEGKTFQAEVTKINLETKAVNLKLNGKPKLVKLQDEYDLLVKKMGLSANVIHKISTIKAPMPGLVLSILVEPGQAVVHGEPMLILEAMKMENVIKSPGEGKVKKIVVSKGKAVDKGEVLIEME
ncbi:MAG: acetyl-CoA carboxylase biotin carboxyl carrier protein subunit [Saprospiraceae bacterium]|nr:acetyl-CoA carboxylase biotin carboxyl carrier protein subunit [Saprospiraceae bacterium]